MWVKLRFLGGAGPRGPRGGRGGVTCRRCASGEGSASCASGSGAPTPPRRPAPAPRGPAARPRGSVPPLSPEALAHPPPAPPPPPALSVLLVRSMASASWRSKVSGGQVRSGVRPAGERRAWVGGRGAGCGSGRIRDTGLGAACGPGGLWPTRRRR